MATITYSSPTRVTFHPILGQRGLSVKRVHHRGYAKYYVCATNDPDRALEISGKEEMDYERPNWKVWLAVTAMFASGAAVVYAAMSHAPVTAPAAAAGGALIGAAGTIAVQQALK